METNRQDLERASDLYGLLGHPYRIRILQIVNENQGATWTQIVNGLEKTFGKINPNTVNFHLIKLTQGGLLEKAGSDVYSLTEESKDPIVIKAIRTEARS